MTVTYETAYDALKEAFVNLARAKQDYVFAGGGLEFSVHRNELIMTWDGGKMSFPYKMEKSNG